MTRRLVRLTLAIFTLMAVLFVAGFPVRTYLEQREALTGTTERLDVLRKSNEALDARVKELHSDEAVERLAREQYNLVRPGEEAYAILPGPEAPPAPKAPVEKAAEKGVLSQVWDTITFWD